MVDALVTIALEGILKNLLVAAENEVVLAWGYREKLTEFHNTVKIIHGMLRDAERQKGTKDGVMEWLKILKDGVGEADAVFDEIDYEMLRLEVKKRNKMERKVPSLPSLKKFTFRIRMAHKIEDISKKLYKILEKADALKLHSEQVVHTSDSLDQVETDSFLEESSIVGRENDAQHIIQLLTRSREVEEKLVIVPIVGMGGIGKTTLAKSIYNNQKIQQHFDVRAWLCVSDKVKINTLLPKIYESLTEKKCNLPTRESLIAGLRKELGAKRYLLVLDDVWDERKDHWDDFKSCMLKVNSENGSSILVTSRNREIGTNEMTKDSYTLKVLPDDQCWSIFEERAFGVGRPPIPELVEIGRDIVKKCHGLPLVVSVIGAMLRQSYNDKEKWESIKNSNVWYLEEGKRVQSALKLSFDNLPNTVLKQCFAYFSTFPKDVFMEREQLIQYWMALGLLQADEARNKEMEDVGNDIFQTLVSNSLLQDVEKDKYGRIFGCKMHDLVHDLSLSLTGHENLCLVEPTINDVRISQVKHLAILSMYEDQNMSVVVKNSFKEMISKVFKEDIMTSTTLHTLFFNGEVEKNISLRIFKSLRILNLSGCYMWKLHNSIGDLVHLRYLDLSRTRIDVLPRSIGKLYHLQTLKLVRCYNLKELPEDVKNLINLRHFEFDADSLSPKVGQLTSLRTLSAFFVGQKKGNQIEELGRLKHLRGKLCISHLEKISSKEDASKANLSEKNVLEIVFRWSINRDANRNDKDVLEGLQPHANVKSLEIENFSGDNFPPWVMEMAINIQGKWTPLDKLMKITLSGCSSCHSLPMLGNLPLLRELVLEDMHKLTCLSTSLGPGNVVTEPGKPLFPSLRSLSLKGMIRLEKWTDAGMNSSTMLSPVLEKLKIFCCPKLILLDEYHQHPLVSLDIDLCENLQSIQSIQGLTSLESLSINRCESLSRIPDLHNQCHSLKSLEIINCDKLTSLPGGLECLAFLNNLQLGPFSDELDSFPSLQGIEKLGSHLRSLMLRGRDHWVSIPEEVKHLTALTELTIWDFGMQELPIWLRNMSSIRKMKFYYCKGLDIETVRRGAPTEAIEVELDNGEWM